MKPRFLLAISLICTILFSTVLLQAVAGQAAQAASDGLTTQKLTDPSATVYDAQESMIAAGSGNAHIIWTEYISYPTPPDYDPDIDLFYAQLPANEIKQLKATSGKVSNSHMAVDSNDQVHIVWAEDTKTSEGSDLFYWTTGMATPQDI
ncbi:MAG: hypothetical protein P8183_06200, partial [Anaerolineae bacterium]